MTLLSRLMGRMAHLPPAETYAVLVERDLQVPMPDGVVLLADRYALRGVEHPPLLLVRSPYGRRGIFGTAYGRLFAERGFQVVMQSTRGTFGPQPSSSRLAPESTQSKAEMESAVADRHLEEDSV